MLKIAHTADNHIGMKFNKYGPLKKDLVEARFKSLKKLVDKANDRCCDLLVISGDLFDSINIARPDIEKTVGILKEFSGEYVLIIPGNHDFYSGNEDLWKIFSSLSPLNFILLNNNLPFTYKKDEITYIFYPFYCDSKHSKENKLSTYNDKDYDNNFYKIGIAHGAVEGLSLDMEGRYFYMSNFELENSKMDLWLIGHTHTTYPKENSLGFSRVLNPGTHEPDGMNYREAGGFFYIEIDDKVNFEFIESSTFRFYDFNYRLGEVNTIIKLKDELLSKSNKNNLVRINLTGTISLEDYEIKDEIFRELKDAFFTLILELIG